MDKHTPGPWVVEETIPESQFKDEKGKYNYGAQKVLVLAEGDCALHPVADASANHTCRSQAECEANASLIAAAPDLLEACQTLVEFMDREYPNASVGEYWPTIAPLIEQGRAAIKKARSA